MSNAAVMAQTHSDIPQGTTKLKSGRVLASYNYAAFSPSTKVEAGLLSAKRAHAKSPDNSAIALQCAFALKDAATLTGRPLYKAQAWEAIETAVRLNPSKLTIQALEIFMTWSMFENDGYAERLAEKSQAVPILSEP